MWIRLVSKSWSSWVLSSETSITISWAKLFLLVVSVACFCWVCGLLHWIGRIVGLPFLREGTVDWCLAPFLRYHHYWGIFLVSDVILAKWDWVASVLLKETREGRILATVFPALQSCSLLASFLFLFPTASNCIIFQRFLRENIFFESVPFFFLQSSGFFKFAVFSFLI